MEDQAAYVIEIEGEATSETADWLEHLGQLRLTDTGAHLVVDCTGTNGISGHLLGALRRVAAAATECDALFGVVADGPTAGVVEAHVPNVVAARTRAELSAIIHLDCEGSGVAVSGPGAHGEPATRYLWWAGESSAQPTDVLRDP